MSVDRTRYLVILPGPLTASGQDEIVHATITAGDARAWAREQKGPYWRRTYRVRARHPRPRKPAATTALAVTR